jgi:hypothetical protein
MSVFVDPEPAIAHVSDERGRDLVAPFRDALQASLSEAGYRVATASSSAHDLDVHMVIDRVGWTYGRPWVNELVLELSGGGQPVARLHRASLNYVSDEGADASARLTFAARTLVNAMTHDAGVMAYATTHRTVAASSDAPAAPSTGAPPAMPAPAAPSAETSSPAPAPVPAR